MRPAGAKRGDRLPAAAAGRQAQPRPLGSHQRAAVPHAGVAVSLRLTSGVSGTTTKGLSPMGFHCYPWRSCALVLMLALVPGAAAAARDASSTAGHGRGQQPDPLLHCRQGPRGTYSSILRVSHEVGTEELAVAQSPSGGSSRSTSSNNAASSSSSQHAAPDAGAVANGTLLSSQLLLSKGYFLHVHATYDVTACTAAHTSYSLQLRTQSCHGFETGNGSATPEAVEDCTPDVGCRLGQSRDVQACRQGCHHWLLRQAQATFKVDASGAFLADTLQLKGREWRTANGGTAGAPKTEQQLERMWAACNNGRSGPGAPADSGEQGGGSSSPEQQAPQDATLRGLFDIFARQAHIRHDNVSEELHVVQATAYIPTADRRPGSAMPSPDGSQRRPEHDSSRSRDSGPGIGGSGGEHTNEGSSTDPHGAHRPVQLTYTFNAESTVYPLHPSAVGLAAGWDGAGQGTGSQRATAEGTPPSADGADDGVGGGSAAEQLSRLVLSRQYLVPSEQAHAAMGQYGTADLPAGHYSHTWLAPGGRMLMRVDATVTEAPLSAAPAAVEPATGTGTAGAAAAPAETATPRASAQGQGTRGSRSRSGSGGSSSSTGGGDGYGGNGTRTASRVLTRMRLMVTSELLHAEEAQGPGSAPGCSSGVGGGAAGGEADCAGGTAAAHGGWRRRLAAAQHPAVVSHKQLLAARAADAYPDGGYERFIQAWKQQLQDRRKHRRKQQRYGEQREEQRAENEQGPPPTRRRSRDGGTDSHSDTPGGVPHDPSQTYRARVGSWHISSVQSGSSSARGSGSSSKGRHGAAASATEGLSPGELGTPVEGRGTAVPKRRIVQAVVPSVCGNTMIPGSGFYIDINDSLFLLQYMRALLCKANEECQLGSYGWFLDDDDGGSNNGNPEFDVKRVREVHVCCFEDAQKAGVSESAESPGSVQGVILKFDPGYHLGQLALTKSCRNTSEARHVFKAAPDEYLGGFYVRSEVGLVSLLTKTARIITIEPSWLKLSPSTLPPSPPPPSPPPPAWESTMFITSDAEYVDGNQRLGMAAAGTYKTGSSRYEEDSAVHTLQLAANKASRKPPKRAASSTAEVQHHLVSSYAGMTAPPLRILVKARIDAVDDPVRGPRFTRARTSKSYTALDGSYRAEIPWDDHFLMSFIPLRPCNYYARGTYSYTSDRGSATRLLRISLRFRVWFLELRVSLISSWTTSTLVKMCELDGLPALGIGAALTGETYGSLEVAINLFFVKVGVEFSMMTVSVNTAAFSTWTAGMLLNSDSQRPACTATDLLVRGLALSVNLNVRVFWFFRFTKEVWRSPGWTLVRKATGLECPNPAEIRALHRAAQQPPPPAPESPTLLPSTAAQRATSLQSTRQEEVLVDAETSTAAVPLCRGSLWLNGYYTYVSPAAAAYLTPDIRQRLQRAEQPAGDRDQQYATTALQLPTLQPPTTTQRTAGPWSWLGDLGASAFPDAVQLLPYTQADLPCRWILSGPPGSALHYTLWYLDLHAGDSVSIVSYTVTNTASTAGVGAAAGAAAGDTSMTMRTTTMSTPHAIFTGRVLPSKPVSGVIPLCCYQEVHISLQLSQVGSLATTGATRAAGALPRYGFFITFSVEAMPSPPPPPAAPPISTPMQPASSDTPPEVCEGVLLMHDGLQSSPASGYVTSDLRWRLWADGTDPWADGSRAAWRRPDLPYTSNPDYGDPGQWLMSYSRGSRCSWEFRLDVGTAVDFSVRFLNLLPGVDTLHVWAPTSEATGGDGSSSGGGGGDDDQQQPMQQDWSPADLDALLRNPAWHRSLRVLSHEAIGAGGPVVTLTVSEPRFFVTLTSPRIHNATEPPRRGVFLQYSVRQQPVDGSAPPPPPLPPVPPILNLWDELSLPPPPPPPQPPQLPAFPSFPPETQAPPAPAEPSAENAPLCLSTFLVHNDNYTTPDGCASGYLTHDLHRRRSVANLGGDGGEGPLALPPLPPGDPATWLPEYPPGLTCSWTFRTPPHTYITLTLVFLDTEPGMDLLRVTAPAPGPLSPGAPELLTLASFSGATTDPRVAAHNPLTILAHHTFTVTFESDFATQGRGFLMTYSVRPRPATWPPSPPPPSPPPPLPPPAVLCVPRLVVYNGERMTSLEGSYITDDLSFRLEQARTTTNPTDPEAATVDPAAPEAAAGPAPGAAVPPPSPSPSISPIALPALPGGHPSTWLTHLYGPNADCSWVIRAPLDALIRVELRYLDTEQGYDQLLVEDDDTGQQLAAYTGRLPAPAPALTAPPTTRALRLRFTSDAVPKYGGFYLRYWVLPPDLLAAFRPPPPPPYAKAALRSAFAKAGEGALCDPVLVTHGSGYFTAPGGAFITSDMRWRLGQAGVGEQEDGSQRPLDMARLQLLPPGDPGGWLQPYAPGTDCTWLLALPAAATATLVVSYLDLEPGGPDRLTVSDHLTGEELAAYGGSSMGTPLPPLTLTHTRVVQLRLTSDAARQGRGFVARYWVAHRAGLVTAPGSGGGGLGAAFADGSSVAIRGPAVVQDGYAAGASCTSSSSTSGSQVQLAASTALTFMLDASEARDAVGLPFARAMWFVLQAPPGAGPAAGASQQAVAEPASASGGADGGGVTGSWAALAAAVAAANSNATDWHSNMRLLLTHAEALALPAGTYVVRVELWAVGSEEPASAAHSFLRLGAPAAPSGRATTGELLPPPSPPVGTAFLEGLVVSLAGPPHRVVTAMGGLELQAVDELAAWGLEQGDWAGEGCAAAANGIPRLTWTWSVPPSLAGLAATVPSGSSLALRGPLGLAHGETVTLSVTAASDDKQQGTEATGAPPSPTTPPHDAPSSPLVASTRLAPPLPPGSPPAPPASVTPALQPSFASASTTVTVLHSPPIAVLRGPCGDVPVSVGRILLDASASWDPNTRPLNPPASTNSSSVPTTPPASPISITSSSSSSSTDSELLFEWVCWRPDDPDASCGLAGNSHPTRAQWELPLSGLQPGTWHVLSVVVTLAPYDAVVGAPPLRAVASLAVRPQADSDEPKSKAIPLLPALELAEHMEPDAQDSPTASADNGADGAGLPMYFAPTAPHNLDQPLLLLLDTRQVLWEAAAGAAAQPPKPDSADAGPGAAWLDTATIEWATGSGDVVGSTSFRADTADSTSATSLTPPPPALIEAAAQKAHSEEQQLQQHVGAMRDGVGTGQAGQRRRQQQELATPYSATTSAVRVIDVPLPGVLLVAVSPGALLGRGQQGAGEPAPAPGAAVLTATLKTPTSGSALAPSPGGTTLTAALAVTLNQPPQCALPLGSAGPGDNASACFVVEYPATAAASTGSSAAANASGTPAAADNPAGVGQQGALAAVLVRAAGFVDPEGHLPLSYEFGVRHASLPGVGPDAVVQLGADPQAVLLLPLPRRTALNATASGVEADDGANGGSVRVYVCVTDALGARTCVDRAVPLAPGKSPEAGEPDPTGEGTLTGTDPLAAIDGDVAAVADLQRHLRVLQQQQPGSDPGWPVLRRSAWRAVQLMQHLAAARGEAPGPAATPDGGVSPAAAALPPPPGAQEEQLVAALGALARVAVASGRHERVLEAASALAAFASSATQLLPASPTLRSAAASAALSLTAAATAQLDSLRATAPTGPGGRPAGAGASAAQPARIATQVVGCACQAIGPPAALPNMSSAAVQPSFPADAPGSSVGPSGYNTFPRLLLGPHLALLDGAAAALARAAVPLAPPLAAGDAAAYVAAAALPGLLLPAGQGGDGGPGGAPDEDLVLAVSLCAGPGAPASWPHCEPLTQARAQIVVGVGVTNWTGSGGGGSGSSSTQPTLAGAAGVMDGAVSLQFMSNVRAVAAAVAAASFAGASNSSAISLNATVVSGLARVRWHARGQQQQQQGQPQQEFQANPPGGAAPAPTPPQGNPPISPGSAQPPAPPPPQVPEATGSLSITLRLPLLLPYLDSDMALVCGRYEEAAAGSGVSATTSASGAGGEGEGGSGAVNAAAAGAALLPAGLAEAYDPDSGTAGCRAAAGGWYLVLVMPEAQARAVWEAAPTDSGGGGGGGGSGKRRLAVGLAVGLVVGVLLVASAVAFAVVRRRRAARISPGVPGVAFKKDVSCADLSPAGLKGGGGLESDNSTSGQLSSWNGSAPGTSQRLAPVSRLAAARLLYGQALQGDYPERLDGPPPAAEPHPSGGAPLPPHCVQRQEQHSLADATGGDGAAGSGGHGAQQGSSSGAAVLSAHGIGAGTGSSVVGKLPGAVRPGARAALPPLEVGQDRAARLQALLAQGAEEEEENGNEEEEQQRVAERPGGA